MSFSEYFREIFNSIQRNSLRTLLSGFIISIGIFIFIILFGLGNGLNNGFESKFKNKLNNYITVKFNQFNSGTILDKSDSINSIMFKKKDYSNLIKKNRGNISQSSVIKSKEVIVKYKSENAKYSLLGVESSYKRLGNITIIKGEFLSKSSNSFNQNNVVIGKYIEKELFKNKSSLGEKIIINNIFFNVIGVFINSLNELEEQKIYLSQEKFSSLFISDENIESFILSNNKKTTLKEAISFKKNLKNQIKESLNLNQSEESNIKIASTIENGNDANNFLMVINLVVIFIGLGTLISGTIGISNVILYIVKDRFFEIGIRKAVGAKSNHLILMIVGETILTMLFFGVLGIILGTIILSLIGNNLNKYYILNPYVKYSQILLAFVIMLFLGFIAGLIPANYAAKLKPSDCINKNQY